MIWIFLAVALWLAVMVPGFRKFLGYAALASGGLLLFIILIASIAAR